MTSFKKGHALMIGIGNDLPMTVDDAQIIHDVFADPNKAAYPKENIQLVTGPNATRKNIEAALDKLIEASKQDDNDTAVIYYSGHGAQVPWIDGKQHYFLVPYDAKFDSLDTLLPAEIFTKKINEIEASKLLLILDCCHAGGQNQEGELISKSFEPKSKNIANTNEQIIKTLEGGNGRIFIASCKDNELSYIGKGDTNSLFTKHLAHALRGDSSDDNDFVHVIDLIQHVFRTVPEEATNRLKVSQTPIINYADGLDAHFYVCANSNAANNKLAIADATASKNRNPAEVKEFLDKFKESNGTNIVDSKNVVQGNIIEAGRDVQIGDRTTIVNNYYGEKPKEEEENPVAKDVNINADTKPYLKEAKKLIAKDKTQDAIDLLLDHTDDDEMNMLIMLSSRLKNITNQINMMMIAPGQAMVAKNQINNSLLNLISDLEDQ